MTDIAKFLSDVEKIKKHDRHEHNNQNDYNRLSDQIARVFEKSSTCPATLSNAIFDYWEKEYIWNSADLSEEPTAEHLGKLGAFLSFLDNSDEDAELISDDDWKNIAELVNFEAEDLPIDVLTDLMKVLVDKGAI